MRSVALLGSTGSIGKNTLQIVSEHPDSFSISVLTANTQVELLIEQAIKFKPRSVCIVDDSFYTKLKQALSPYHIECFSGMDALVDLVREADYDVLLNAIVGAAGMQSTIEAVRSGRDVALSNKESLVMAGELINSICAETGAKLFPVDSEHSAIWQCLVGEDPADIDKLILTGSGGPFLKRDLRTFSEITVAEALKHPNWSMGKKISIDSATMFNKALELIEAVHLFHLDESKIDILIHPESIIHSMVQFKDGSVKAQLGVPDMKVPIQYALSYPRHLKSKWPKLDLAEIGTLHFENPNQVKFPSLRIAREVLRKGGTYPAVLNMANERAVAKFLAEKISFTGIFKEVEAALESHSGLDPMSVDDLLTIIRDE
ncbi:MAG: 1-deoxy-D-xylulose-5-phosphate reductoisomerase [Candidatus Neomarinimicrobiota bacterium]